MFRICVKEALVLPNIKNIVVYGKCDGTCKIGDMLFQEDNEENIFSITEFPLIRNSWTFDENHIFLCIKSLSHILISKLTEQVEIDYLTDHRSKKDNQFILDQVNRRLAETLRGKTFRTN